VKIPPGKHPEEFINPNLKERFFQDILQHMDSTGFSSAGGSVEKNDGTWIH